MIAGFRSFISRSNIVELAVAVVIGTAFGAVITSLVADLITPVIGVIAGEQDFSDLTFTINGSEFRYGSFLNALIAFLTIAAAIYFVVVAPLEAVERRRHGGAGSGARQCPECLSEVPAAAVRCAFCTSPLPAATPSPPEPS